MIPKVTIESSTDGPYVAKVTNKNGPRFVSGGTKQEVRDKTRLIAIAEKSNTQIVFLRWGRIIEEDDPKFEVFREGVLVARLRSVDSDKIAKLGLAPAQIKRMEERC